MVSHYTGPILRIVHCMSHFVNHLRDFLTNPNCCCLLDSRQNGWSPKSRSHFVSLSKSNLYISETISSPCQQFIIN
jgi:hypothetical protein